MSKQTYPTWILFGYLVSKNLTALKTLTSQSGFYPQHYLLIMPVRVMYETKLDIGIRKECLIFSKWIYLSILFNIWFAQMIQILPVGLHSKMW